MLFNRRTFLLNILLMSGAIAGCINDQAITAQTNLNQGISFFTEGKVIKEYQQKK